MRRIMNMFEYANNFIVYIDGASKGNPGPSSCGIVIKNSDGETMLTISQPIGIATNNQAEYRALIEALKFLLCQGRKYSHIVICSDSEVLVKQLNGLYQVKNLILQDLYNISKELISSFKDLTLVKIPREQNKEADKAANNAITPDYLESCRMRGG